MAISGFPLFYSISNYKKPDPDCRKEAGGFVV
jgi:hypothetical protein